MKTIQDKIIQMKLPKELVIYIYSFSPQLNSNILKINSNVKNLSKRWIDYKIIIEAYKSLTFSRVINDPEPLHVFMLKKSKHDMLLS